MRRQFILILLLLIVAPLHAATVDVMPASSAIFIGQTVSVQVSVSGFPQVGGASLGLSWNPAVLDLNSIALGGTSGFDSLVPVTPTGGEQAAGYIDLVSVFGDLFAPENDPIGTFDAFVMEFAGDGEGISAINLLEGSSNLGPERGWNRTDDLTLVAGVVYNQGSVSVTLEPVPIPATWSLLLSGLAVLGGLRRRAVTNREKNWKPLTGGR